MDPIKIDTTPRPPSPAPRPAPTPWINAVVGLVLTVAILGGAGAWGVASLRWSAARLAADAEEQYQIQLDAGAGHVDLGVRAGLVAECYLQAQDREGYRRWKAVEQQHMRAAGVPIPR